jgi:hypothetical protein
MSAPTITPDQEAGYMRIMADFDEAMREHCRGPVPMCHFKPMTFHADDSDSGGDGYHHAHRTGFGNCKILLSGEYKEPLQ